MSSNLVKLPEWLLEIRKAEIVQALRDDSRTVGGRQLGLSIGKARQLIKYGQADFDRAVDDFTPDDLALLYAYYNQKMHLEELVAAFGQIFSDEKPDDPIVLDIGCGPFTGGLALLATLGKKPSFDYIGVDRAKSMWRLGEKLARSELVTGEVTTHWFPNVSSVVWQPPRSWRDVIVVLSYLFASPTLDVDQLVDDLVQLVKLLGQGPVTVLYTNAIRDTANTGFQLFQAKLEEAGYTTLVQEQVGEIQRLGAVGQHAFRYSLLRLASRYTLEIK